MDSQIILHLYRGRVISIDDPDQKGKVQVKMLPEMVDIRDKDCPWFQPFNGNSSDSELKNNPPQVGSLIWVLADDKFFHRFYTDFKYDIDGKFNYSNVDSVLGAITGLDKEYKNIQFTLYEDKSLSFHNRVDGSHGIISSNGAYYIIDKDGKIRLNSDADNAVRYSALETAFNELNDKYNKLESALSSVIGGTPIPEPGNGSPSAFQTALAISFSSQAPLPSTADITPSKIDNILVP